MQVSIIMPYYNAAKYINETVDAIIAQTYKSWELIIVDDCSPAPGTNDILKSIAAMDSRREKKSNKAKKTRIFRTDLRGRRF